MSAQPELNPTSSKPLRLIRLAEVKRRTGMSTSTIYRWMSQGKFPKSYAIGDHIAAWFEAEIENWIAGKLARMEASQKR